MPHEDMQCQSASNGLVSETSLLTSLHVVSCPGEQDHVPRLVLLLLVLLMVVVLLLLVVVLMVVVLLLLLLLMVVVVLMQAACPGRPACPCRQSCPRLRAMGHISCPAWGMGYGPLTPLPVAREATGSGPLPLPVAREAGRRPRCRFR
jgi:hypothetical protein